MTDRAETGLNERRSWSGRKEQNGSPHSAFLCSCFALSFFISLPHFQDERYIQWSLLLNEHCQELRPMERSVQFLLQQELPELWSTFKSCLKKKWKYPSLQFGRKSQVYRLLFHEFADHLFLSPHKVCSLLSVAVTRRCLAPKAIFLSSGSFLNEQDLQGSRSQWTLAPIPV